MPLACRQNHHLLFRLTLCQSHSLHLSESVYTTSPPALRLQGQYYTFRPHPLYIRLVHRRALWRYPLLSQALWRDPWSHPRFSILSPRRILRSALCPDLSAQSGLLYPGVRPLRPDKPPSRTGYNFCLPALWVQFRQLSAHNPLPSQTGLSPSSAGACRSHPSQTDGWAAHRSRQPGFPCWHDMYNLLYTGWYTSHWSNRSNPALFLQDLHNWKKTAQSLPSQSVMRPPDPFPASCRVRQRRRCPSRLPAHICLHLWGLHPSKSGLSPLLLRLF